MDERCRATKEPARIHMQSVFFKSKPLNSTISTSDLIPRGVAHKSSFIVEDLCVEGEWGREFLGHA